MGAARREPLWLLFLLGWLAGGAGEGLFARSGADRAGCAEPPEARPRDLAQLPPRELRRVPGIGEARALAIARARWEAPRGRGPLHLSDVPGIGPLTEARVRAWLEGREEGAAAAPAEGARYPPRAASGSGPAATDLHSPPDPAWDRSR